MPHHRSSFRRQHWAVIALIAANVVAFALQWLLPVAQTEPFECVPADVLSSWRALLAGSVSADGLRSFATLLTYAFLHDGIEHIGFNMFYLWVFAYLVGELIGQRWVVATYAITAIGGAICYVIFEGDSPVHMLGASGAVSGFEGAYLGLAVRYAIPDPHVWPMSRPVSPAALCALAILGVGLDLSGTFNSPESTTAFTVHLGGFVTGLALTSFFTPAPRGVSAR